METNFRELEERLVIAFEAMDETDKHRFDHLARLFLCKQHKLTIFTTVHRKLRSWELGIVDPKSITQDLAAVLRVLLP